LQAFMARCGVGSRRHCERYIREGRVTVNGAPAALGSRVSHGDEVRLDGRRLRPERLKVYLAVNKPEGFLCANRDPQGRPLVLDLLEDVPQRLFHVGRLDYNSSGLIFYTNDGEFARAVGHPSSGIEKEYLVQARGAIPDSVLLDYRRGIQVEGQHYTLKSYRRVGPSRVRLVLVEGKNREIRVVFRQFGLAIRRIQRVRIGCVRLQGVPKGGYRSLTATEVSWFLHRSRGVVHGRGD
jgi:23S rRNA pseudouridine2605 synthase